MLTPFFNIAFIILFIIGSISFAHVLPSTVFKNELVFVEYVKNGKVFILNGQKTAQGYQFNTQSKKIVSLATSAWPPYISEEKCYKGWVFNFTVALLVSKGYQVNINFYPWARAQMLVEQGRIDILFPEYVIDESAISNVIINKKRHELLTLTDDFPGGKISLVTHKDNPATDLGDLSLLHHKIVGVVRGYTNSEEIDAMIHKEQFSVVEAVNELQLMKLLVAKRVDFIVGDKKAFTHTVESSNLTMQRKQRLLNNIKYLQPALTQHTLFYALSNKNPHHTALLTDINSALASFELSGLTEQFIHDETHCHSKNRPLTLI